MDKAEQLVVHEIYPSIQGETTWAGVPCALVRLTGCNLRCRWCDTPQAFYGGRRMSRREVLDEALSHGTPLVALTGGEPLLQPGALPLLRELADAGRTVLLETSGERDISEVDARVCRILDLKAPGSGESHRNRWDNVALLRRHDEVKLVLADRRDYEWARDVIREQRLHERAGAVLLGCVWGELEARDLARWMLEDHLPARLQIQMHKHMWSPETTGV